MDQQAQQQINQLKVIALQSAQGDIIKAMDIFNWLSLDYETDVIARYMVQQGQQQQNQIMTQAQGFIAGASIAN